MNVEDKLIKYQDEKGEPSEYQVVEDTDSVLMGIAKGSKDENPILNYILIRNLIHFSQLESSAIIIIMKSVRNIF